MIRRMTATFGRLNQTTLQLKSGLNILEAPNETGKSTWCAFLSAMFYGINSRERDRSGALAHKNRFAPWSGAAMAGRMDLRTLSGEDWTIQRTTSRPSAPMGTLSVTYTDTGTTVPGLSAPDFGEQVLGIPRQVFERSAFIRQSGLSVTEDPELEKRMVSLITTGDDHASYIIVSDALRRQLNRRQHYKTGEIPEAEAQLAEISSRLKEQAQLRGELQDLRCEKECLLGRQANLMKKQRQYEQHAAAENFRVLLQARKQAEAAEQTAAALEQRLTAERIPENEAIGRLRGAIVNLETTRKAAAKARDSRDEAQKILLRAEAAAGESPFAGMTPEEAKREISAPPRVSIRIGPALGIFFGGLALAAACLAGILTEVPKSLTWRIPLACGVPALLVLLSAVLSHRMRHRAGKQARTAALLKRFGTADSEKITALAGEYETLCQARDSARTGAAAAKSTADSLYSSLTSNEQGILLEVRRFAPSAFDIANADRLLRECAVRRRKLTAAEAAVREARLKYEILAQHQPAAPEVPAPGEPPLPAESPETLSAGLAEVQTSLAALNSRIDRLTGQIGAAGDPAQLAAAEEQLTGKLEQLRGEYQSLELALEALESANTALQQRFSPALGRRTAQIFSELTGERYDGVVLDRSFRLSVQPKGDSLYRDAQFLSAGALDQLYLAVRLAICELVMPQNRDIPMVLDDALTSFDDGRCASALRWLRRESEHRQILLFTCHHREADFFRNDPSVSIQELTNPSDMV